MADQDLNDVTAAETVDEMAVDTAVDGLDEVADGLNALADLMADAIDDI
jgi:X-X-X-Leu-X-X-Gly heptad repeat protein